MLDDGRTRTLKNTALAFAVLVLVTIGFYGLFWAIDFLPAPHPQGPLSLMLEEGTTNTISGLGEVTVGILGIAITVVAIIVELAANRYTSRITELFVADPVNGLVMGFMVVTAVFVLWTEMSLYGDHYPANMVLAATAMMSASLFALLPYFVYIFAFLSPTSVVRRIQTTTQDAIRRSCVRARADVARERREVLTGIDQLGDIALNSVEKKDKAMSIATVNALAGILEESLGRKSALPPAWFATTQLAGEDADFVAFHPEIVKSLTDRRTWLEMKVLRQYQTIFSESLHILRDVNHLVSIRTVQLAVTAARLGDDHALTLLLRFVNTYLRATMNAKDVRTAYNLFNDVRSMAEHLLATGREDRVVEIAERMKYYGQLAFNINLPFIHETVAYDMCALLERASEAHATCHDALLSIFLELDRQPDKPIGAQEASLRGVRKAQVKLATYYLAAGMTEPARRIYADMCKEPRARMISIREELEAIVDPEFWEVSDRGINFDYVTPERRTQLAVFFRWFEEGEWKDREPA